MGIEQGASVEYQEQTWPFPWFSHSAVSPCRGELCWLLEENSLLRSQLGRLQQELSSGQAVLAEKAAQLKDAQASAGGFI